MVASGSGWKLQISQVGPGVFFALFGAAVLIYTLNSKVTTNGIATTNSTDQKDSFTVSSALPAGAPANPSTSRDYLIALTTLSHEIKTLTPANPELKKLDPVFGTLEPLRRDLLDDALGSKGRYAEWYRLNQMRENDPAGLSQTLQGDTALRKRFEESDETLNRTLPL
jgi:hypothetical protein